MSEPVFVAWGKCYGCSSTVAVKKNKSGLAYCNCDFCGLKIQHTRMTSSNKMCEALGAPVADPESVVVPANAQVVSAKTLLG